MPTPPRPGPPGPGAPRPGAPRPGAPRPSGQRPGLPPRPASLVERAIGILFQPTDTWLAIAGEFTTAGRVYWRYVIPLSALPALCQIAGNALWGMSVPFFGRLKIPLTTALQSGGVSYVLGLVGVSVLAMLINALAPTFGGTRNTVQAVKVAAYSLTASWVAGVFVLVPGGRWLTLLGLYSLYLLYAGLGPVMKTPRDRVLGYTVVVGVAAIVLYLIISTATTAFLPQPRR